MKNEEEIIKTKNATSGDMERINYYRSKVAKDDDTFEFGCNGCGDCCRHRDESIILSGADVFRLARYLEVKPDNLFEKHLEWSIGKTSRLPVVYLHEKATGSCAFLHKGLCSVHDVYLTACRIYPLGRMLCLEKTDGNLDMEEFINKAKYQYFVQNIDDQCKKNKHQWVVKDYLETFHVRDHEREDLAWQWALTHMVSKYRDRLESEEARHVFSKLAMVYMYVGYNIKKDYIEQLQENMDILDHLMSTGFGKIIDNIDEINKTGKLPDEVIEEIKRDQDEQNEHSGQRETSDDSQNNQSSND